MELRVWNAAWDFEGPRKAVGKLGSISVRSPAFFNSTALCRPKFIVFFGDVQHFWFALPWTMCYAHMPAGYRQCRHLPGCREGERISYDRASPILHPCLQNRVRPSHQHGPLRPVSRKSRLRRLSAFFFTCTSIAGRNLHHILFAQSTTCTTNPTSGLPSRPKFDALMPRKTSSHRTLPLFAVRSC